MKLVTILLVSVSSALAQVQGQERNIGFEGAAFNNAPAPSCKAPPGGVQVGTRFTIYFPNWNVLNIGATAAGRCDSKQPWFLPQGGTNIAYRGGQAGSGRSIGRIQKQSSGSGSNIDNGLDLSQLYFACATFTVGQFVPFDCTLVISGTPASTTNGGSSNGGSSSVQNTTIEYQARNQMQLATLSYSNQRYLDFYISAVPSKYGNLGTVYLLIDSLRFQQ